MLRARGATKADPRLPRRTVGHACLTPERGWDLLGVPVWAGGASSSGEPSRTDPARAGTEVMLGTWELMDLNAPGNTRLRTAAHGPLTGKALPPPRQGHSRKGGSQGSQLKAVGLRFTGRDWEPRGHAASPQTCWKAVLLRRPKPHGRAASICPGHPKPHLGP